MKKSKIQKVVLNNVSYDADIYRIVTNICMDDIITRISDEEVVSNVDPKEIYSAEEQLVCMLNKFIGYFKRKFYNLYPHHAFNIINLIEQNQESFYKYLSNKYYTGDNDYIRYFEDSINRLSITSFVKNIEYIPELKKFIKKNKIKIKDINDYTFEEVMQISKIISDITLANHNQVALMLLFTDINELHKKDEKVRREACLNHYNFMYKMMIDEYNRKKECIQKLQEIWQ